MLQKRKLDIIEVKIVKLSTLDSKHIKLFTIDNNDCSELGFGYDIEEMKYSRYVESLTDFNIVKISCESALGRVMKSEDPIATDKNMPAFAQGLDDA
ncbi:25160_t:CDS:2, partial [Gigaspora margarita]